MGLLENLDHHLARVGIAFNQKVDIIHVYNSGKLLLAIEHCISN